LAHHFEAGGRKGKLLSNCDRAWIVRRRIQDGGARLTEDMRKMNHFVSHDALDIVTMARTLPVEAGAPG
jgi:hypothetical protein